MKQLVIYVHGKGGSEKEADHYRPLFAGSTVIGFDYQSQDPWHAEKEFSDFFDQVAKGYDSVVLVANSIGAFFAMSGLAEKKIEKAFFHLSYRFHGEADRRHDESVQYHGRGTPSQRGNRCRFWGDLIVGVPLLCSSPPGQMAHPHLCFIWREGQPDLQRDHIRFCRTSGRFPYDYERWRALVSHRFADEISR